ncbi:DUF2059 domain-containing protein [Pontibacter qinzhouensis]|uniref:DUF2059 domain-containing protein n=1 Tax=Pontibacter qinzhouensis TaxID=2603253 RepID=A0A5C8K9F0_9BACT|nr:DUF2059 domain-containing protein [Pontibacter qinzhouensis]TXK46445.1 DUF2059 domain-containing protein [Pontibacter qinzhouensis]
MKTIFLLLVAFVLCCPAFAQDNAKTKDIKKLLEVTGAADLAMQALQTNMQTLKSSNPNIPTEFFTEFQKEFNAELLLKSIAPIYDKHYTHDEVKQLIKFYQTPLGKKAISTMPLIMEESMEMGQELGKQVAEKVVKKLQAEGKI